MVIKINPLTANIITQEGFRINTNAAPDHSHWFSCFPNCIVLINRCIWIVHAFIYSKKKKEREREREKRSGFSCWKPVFIFSYSVCSILKVKIHDSYFHNKASRGPANKLLYGCTIDFTFTRPDLKGLWDCPWIPNLCATHSLSSWHPLSSVNWQDYSVNRISLPFILRTTGQSGRWQPSDSIQMEMKKASGGMVLFVKHWRELLGSGSRLPRQTGSSDSDFTYCEVSAPEIVHLTQLSYVLCAGWTHDLITEDILDVGPSKWQMNSTFFYHKTVRHTYI